ncbi:MAG: diphthine synthase [Candidatus Diapherotrites archaeon]|nr:diphthine synthase [Candidatus Diapherotrites archaeon]
MLYLIGLGLWDERDLTLRGIDAARKCERVYLEAYTSVLFGTTKERLESTLGKGITVLGREAVEQEAAFLEEAKRKDIALLVGGDPLAATTHSDIYLRAKEAGVDVKVIHNASIFTAVAETGLQLYKFGKTTTITFWEDNYKPTSFYDTAKENKDRSLHTLMLLDIRTEENRFMTANEAIKTMLGVEAARQENVMEQDTDIVVMARAGGSSLIAYGPAGELMERDFGEPLHVLILPSRLHDMERAALETFKY